MIKNERQYRITKTQADKFEQALINLSNTDDDGEPIHPILRQAREEALRSQLVELRVQMREYEALQSGEQKVLEVNSFEDLPMALVRARIAVGLSQKELANRLGLKEQQIQ